MSTAIIDNIDWLKYMRVYGSADADSFEEHFDTDWISAQCRKAALICLSECPIVRTRLKKGRLSESDFASVVCEMVLRVVRFNRFKTEANGSYCTRSMIRSRISLAMIQVPGCSCRKLRNRF